MNSLINIALRSEYSFKKTFGKIDSLAQYSQGIALGIADFNNTYAHPYLEKIAKKQNFKPLYGVRLQVIQDDQLRERGAHGAIYIFIAKNQEGLCEINNLVKVSHDKFYFKHHIAMSDLFEVSNNVVVIAESLETEKRCDYLALTPSTNPLIFQFAKENNIKCVYVNDNYYSTPQDKDVYQLMAGQHKRGDEYYYNFDKKTAPQHILNEHEFNRIWKHPEAKTNLLEVIDQVENFDLKRAPMVAYNGYRSIEVWCEKGAKKLGVDLKDEIYSARYKTEMDLIKDKGYVDYFMIVSEMIEKAKDRMLVGCARGSSCGSLVCYLLGITTIDPIKFGLLFERFIDVNRFDLPDIDIDFPDIKRESVIKDLVKKYGEDNVCLIANINRMKPKSAIGDFATALRIPKYESDLIKDSIDDKAVGDSRADKTIEDAFNTMDIARDFVKKYPAMRLVTQVQNHASHAGLHAAGVIIANDPVSTYGGIDTRSGCIMLDKKQSEYLNLLKIDCLGLRTLTILQECADLVGMNFLDFYDLPLDDKKTFKVFHDMRLYGIFQFDGQSMRATCRDMGVKNFEDIYAITAIARPGVMASGGTTRFVQKRIGAAEIDYVSDHPAYIEATKETYGELVYQEQIMMICKNLAGMSWGEVSEIRKLISKSAGEESFGEYKNNFILGCEKEGVEKMKAETIWLNMIVFGGYAMNKSHSVAYGHISYWCAYMKSHFPLEFTAANLKYAKDKHSAIRILRDAVENEGIEYSPIDPDLSEIDWCVKEGRLLGGLKNIKGIADAKAKEILRARAGEKKYTPSQIKVLLNPVTDFDTIYPCRDYYYNFYMNPQKIGLSSPVEYIKNVVCDVECEFIILGKVIKKELRDLNEYSEILKRHGKVLDQHNKFLKLIVEDDTDQISCRINRFKFDRLDGARWAEELKEDETFVLLKGVVKEGIRIFHINSIFNLTENFDNGEGEDE